MKNYILIAFISALIITLIQSFYVLYSLGYIYNVGDFGQYFNILYFIAWLGIALYFFQLFKKNYK